MVSLALLTGKEAGNVPATALRYRRWSLHTSLPVSLSPYLDGATDKQEKATLDEVVNGLRICSASDQHRLQRWNGEGAAERW